VSSWGPVGFEVEVLLCLLGTLLDLRFSCVFLSVQIGALL
jgi:hypothetical protein